MASEPSGLDVPKPNLGTACVERLMERLGIAPRQRQTHVAEALGISYQQARRRMLGVVPWSVEELNTLAEAFGETLGSLFAETASDGAKPAIFILGSLRLECFVWIGEEVKVESGGPLVATPSSADDWLVMPATEAAGPRCYAVDRVVIRGRKGKGHRVAVLDDEQDAAKSIAEYMCAVGVDAKAFFSIAELSAAIEKQQFDGYAIDWIVDSQSARSLIASIRAKDALCPIVVMTGQMHNGRVDESELAAAASAYRLTYLEKPVRSTSIMSALQLGFEPRGAS